MIVSLLCAGALLAPARTAPNAGDPPAGADLVTRYYDLAAATPEVHGGEYQDLLAPYLPTPHIDVSRSELETWAAAESIAQVVLDAFGEEFQSEGRSLNIDDRGRMRVVAPAAVQKDVAATLAFLEGTFRSAIDLRIDVIERPAGAPLLPALMPLAEAEKLLDGAPGVRSARLSLAPGRVGTLDATHDVRLVADYDVEIAQAAAQHDPVVRSYPVGLRFAARAATVRGGVQLAFLCKDGRQSGPIREVEFDLGGWISNEQGSREVTGRVTLQLLAVLQRSMALSLFLPDGQAAVIEAGTAVQTGTSRAALVLRAIPSAKEPLSGLALASARTRLDVLDASALCPPRLRIDGNALRRGAFPMALDELLQFEASYAVIEASDTSRIEEALSGDSHRSVVSIGPWLVVRTSASEPAAPLTLDDPALTAPVAQESVQLALTLRRGTAVVAQWSGPVLAGATSAISLGGEQLAVTDADVEVAQSASTLDPITTDVYDGLLASVRPARAQDGGWVVELCVRAHLLSGALQKVKLGAPLALVGERGDFDDLISDERLVFAPQKGRPRAMVGASDGLNLEIELR